MEYYSDLNKQVETRQKHQEKPTEVNPSESNTQLPWERSVEKDQRQQKNYGRELNEMMREKEDKKFLESNERLTDEQMVRSEGGKCRCISRRDRQIYTRQQQTD